jgi:hypothetical protein
VRAVGRDPCGDRPLRELLQAPVQARDDAQTSPERAGAEPAGELFPNVRVEARGEVDGLRRAAASSAPSSNTADSSTATGKGQPSPGQPSSASVPPPPTVQPVPPPTAPPTLKPFFNDNDADNVNGGFVPANSDGDGQG